MKCHYKIEYLKLKEGDILRNGDFYSDSKSRFVIGTSSTDYKEGHKVSKDILCYNPRRTIIKYSGKRKTRFIDMFNAIKETREYTLRIIYWKLVKSVENYFLKDRYEGNKFISVDTDIKDMYDRLIKKNEKSKD